MSYRRATLRLGGFVLGFLLVLARAANASPKPGIAEVELGTATLKHRGIAIGPFHAALGIRGAMLGTYLLPWAVPLVDELDSSFVPNGFVKIPLWRRGRFSSSAKLGVLYARLEDIDDDELNVRALITPAQLTVEGQIAPRVVLVGELTGVAVRTTAEKLEDQDSRVHGVALANTTHLAAIARFQWTARTTLWVRGRRILGHAPVLAEATIPLGEQGRLEVRGRANSAELSSAWSGTLGVAHTRGRHNVLLGIGYGHWVLPWVHLPIGKQMPTAELNAYWTF